MGIDPFVSPTGPVAVARETVGAEVALLFRGRGGGGRRSIDVRLGIGGGALRAGGTGGAGNVVLVGGDAEDTSDAQLAVLAVLTGRGAAGADMFADL